MTELKAGNKTFPKTLAQVEKEHIEMVYKSVHGNKTMAAKLLGIGRATMYRKLAEYGIDKKEAPLQAP